MKKTTWMTQTYEQQRKNQVCADYLKLNASDHNLQRFKNRVTGQYPSYQVPWSKTYKLLDDFSQSTMEQKPLEYGMMTSVRLPWNKNLQISEITMDDFRGQDDDFSEITVDDFMQEENQVNMAPEDQKNYFWQRNGGVHICTQSKSGTYSSI